MAGTLSERSLQPLADLPSPRAVPLECIEQELAELWRTYNAEPRGQEPVTRARMSNLVIFCSTQDQANNVLRELPAIVQVHPARVLLLVAEQTTPQPGIDSYVSALCHVSGSQRQICSEYVTLSAEGDSLRGLPSAVRFLLVGDLPTTLWWAVPTAPPLGAELFQELSQLADQVIYDSRGWPDPVPAVVATAEWAASERAPTLVADLAWRHLRPWRRLISQVLDPAVVPGALEHIDAVVVDHGPHALPQAWLLIGWLACHLGWKPVGGKVKPGVEVTWGFEGPRHPLKVTIRRLSEGLAEVDRVSIAWADGRKTRGLTFSRLDEGRLGVIDESAAAPVSVLATPSTDVARMVGRQLSNRGRDMLFCKTLQVSRSMAEAVQ